MAYKDHNGFFDHVGMRVQGLSATARAAEIKSAARDDKDLRDAVQRRRLAQHVIETKGFWIPEAHEMEEANEELETTSAAVKERIDELRKREQDDMHELYEFEAQQYFDEALDMYLSKDDAVLDSGIDALYASFHHPNHPSASLSPHEAYRYSHLKTVLPLQQVHADLVSREKAQQRLLDARFPVNVAQYQKIRNKETLLRIARLLTGDQAAKEKIMTEFGWVYRQVEGLGKEYENNPEFRAEVQERLRELEATDPRRRVSLSDIQ